MRFHRALPLVAALLVLAAAGPAAARGPVRPAPPGPIDLLRGLFGDYSSRCPDDYVFCRGSDRAMCCPWETGCCEDAGGTYCCGARAGGGWNRFGSGYDDDADRYGRYESERVVVCAAHELTCIHEGRTVCCASSDQCCAGPDGPYCCQSRSDWERERRIYP